MSLLTELYAALEEPIGRGVDCAPEDVERLRQSLYRARRESGDAELSALSIRVAPNQKGVWITKDSKPAAEEPSHGNAHPDD